MFFGAVVKPGTTFSLKPEDGEVLHLSGACLQNPSSDDRSYLIFNHKGQDHTLCALKKNMTEHVPLDLFVATRDGGHFKVTGKSEVHLVGYYEPMMSDSEDGNNDDSELDSDYEVTKKPISNKKALKNENSKKAIEYMEDDSDVESNSDVKSDDDDNSDDESDKADNVGDVNDDSDDEGNDDDDDDDDDDDEDEAELIRQSIKEQLKMKAELKKKNKKQSDPVVPATSEAGKKRKAAEQTVHKAVKQNKVSTNTNQNQDNFEKAITEYLKQHGRSLISQVASACPKPTVVSQKYKDFLQSRSNFQVDGQYVILKA